MRGIAIFLAIVLAVPSAVALVHVAPIEHWATPPGAAPQLTPPNPAAGTWPPYLRRSPTARSPAPTQTTGVARILVLLIQFSDTAASASHDGGYFDSRLNATGGSVHSVRSYYQEVSRGALTLNATVISTWFASAHPMSYYGTDSSTGVEDANGPIYRLVVQAVHPARLVPRGGHLGHHVRGLVERQSRGLEPGPHERVVVDAARMGDADRRDDIAGRHLDRCGRDLWQGVPPEQPGELAGILPHREPTAPRLRCRAPPNADRRAE